MVQELIRWFGDLASAEAESPKRMLSAQGISEKALEIVQGRLNLRRDAYLSAAGHKRPGVKAGGPVEDAEQQAQKLTETIRGLLREKREPAKSAANVEAMEKLADLALVPPTLNAAPLAKYDYDKLDYGMTIGIERTPGGRVWACWVAGGDSPKAFFVLATSDDDGDLLPKGARPSHVQSKRRAQQTGFRGKLLRKGLTSVRADTRAADIALNLIRICRVDKVSDEPHHRNAQELLAWWDGQLWRD